MGVQIALAWSESCEEELIAKGFKKADVYMKPAPVAGNTKEQNHKGDADFMSMRYKPYQFVTTSWWGAGPD